MKCRATNDYQILDQTRRQSEPAAEGVRGVWAAVRVAQEMDEGVGRGEILLGSLPGSETGQGATRIVTNPRLTTSHFAESGPWREPNASGRQWTSAAESLEELILDLQRAPVDGRSLLLARQV